MNGELVGVITAAALFLLGCLVGLASLLWRSHAKTHDQMREEARDDRKSYGDTAKLIFEKLDGLTKSAVTREECAEHRREIRNQ